MKAKQTVVGNVPEMEIKSLKDAGYQTAKSHDGEESAAMYVFSLYPSFHETQPDEAVDQLVEGFKLRFYERHKEHSGDKYYKMDKDVPIPVAEGTPGSVKVNVYVGMAYTQQAYGKLKETDKGLHTVLKPLRDAFNKYKGAKLKAIISKCREFSRPEGKSKRGATKAFLAALGEMFAAYDKRVRNSKERGDITADPVKFRMAKDAFMKAYNV